MNKLIKSVCLELQLYAKKGAFQRVDRCINSTSHKHRFNYKSALAHPLHREAKTNLGTPFSKARECGRVSCRNDLDSPWPIALLSHSTLCAIFYPPYPMYGCKAEILELKQPLFGKYYDFMG